MNKAIFLDRDGTINVDFGYVYKTQELELLPGVAEALHIFQELGTISILALTLRKNIANAVSLLLSW